MIEVSNNFFSIFSDLDSKFLRGKIFICCFSGLRAISIESFKTIDDNILTGTKQEEFSGGSSIMLFCDLLKTLCLVMDKFLPILFI